MIWILLYGLIFGSSGNLMMIPKFDKYAKRHIEDNERLEKVILYRKELKTHRKIYQKTYRKIIKCHKHLETDDGVSRDSIESFLDFYRKIKHQTLLVEIDSTIAGKSYITEKEWNGILTDLEKDISKLTNIHDKQKKKVHKQWARIKGCMHGSNKQLASQLSNLQEEYLELYEHSISIQLPSNTLLMQYDLSKEKLILLLNEVLEIEKKIQAKRLDIRDVLLKNKDIINVTKALKHLTKMPY